MKRFEKEAGMEERVKREYEIQTLGDELPTSAEPNDFCSCRAPRKEQL